jgi:hypothetical protein
MDPMSHITRSPVLTSLVAMRPLLHSRHMAASPDLGGKQGQVTAKDVADARP